MKVKHRYVVTATSTLRLPKFQQKLRRQKSDDDSWYEPTLIAGTEVYEDEGRHQPTFTGLYGPDGEPIYYEGVEYVPMGFHHKYDEYGNLIGD